MTRRIVAITVAIALAALGTIGGIYLVVSADSRARGAINDAVRVAVAKTRIPAGTPMSQAADLITFQAYPRTSVPEDYLTTINDDLKDKFITVTVPAGWFVTRGIVGDRNQTNSGIVLPPNKMAVTVQTSVPEQVAGYLRVGSTVSIFLTYRQVKSNGTAGVERTRVLLPKVEVLAIGQPGPNGTVGTKGSQVTVAVSPNDALRLIEGLNHGSLYLALVDDATQVPSGPVDNTDDTGSSTPLFN